MIEYAKHLNANSRNSKIKGIVGTWITLAEYDKDYNIIHVESKQIDGKSLLPNTWYKMKNKEFTAIED